MCKFGGLKQLATPSLCAACGKVRASVASCGAVVPDVRESPRRHVAPLRGHVGGCQNYGPFLGTLNIRCQIILGIQKGTIILTTTHVHRELVPKDEVAKQGHSPILADPRASAKAGWAVRLHKPLNLPLLLPIHSGLK